MKTNEIKTKWDSSTPMQRVQLLSGVKIDFVSSVAVYYDVAFIVVKGIPSEDTMRHYRYKSGGDVKSEVYYKDTGIIIKK